MDTSSDTYEEDGARHSFSILLAEPNSLLREKIAGVLTRQDNVWCVAQVNGLDELLRSAAKIQPDFILAGISILNDLRTVASLRKSSGTCQIVAMTDFVSEPYRQVIQRLGLDGIIEKTEIGSHFTKIIQVLRQQKELQNEEQS